MIEAAFISDLHLHPQDEVILRRFEQFINWAKSSTKSVYILGDFVHVWPGDEALNDWGNAIAIKLHELSKTVPVYLMVGNRDFLIGKKFAKKANLRIIPDPYTIQFDQKVILLSHGDRYCTKDTGHQWLRRLTRNFLFRFLFLKIPYSLRVKLVSTVRNHSQNNVKKTWEKMGIDSETMVNHMLKLKADTIIHGHIHQPGLKYHIDGKIQQFVLSDWDDNPHVLCYDRSNGFYFSLLTGEI
jgi:UDP-2,3-diacylglucosamine hydrolase